MVFVFTNNKWTNAFKLTIFIITAAIYTWRIIINLAIISIFKLLLKSQFECNDSNIGVLEYTFGCKKPIYLDIG